MVFQTNPQSMICSFGLRRFITIAFSNFQSYSNESVMFMSVIPVVMIRTIINLVFTVPSYVNNPKEHFYSIRKELRIKNGP